MTNFVYILRSIKSGRFYIGHSSDPDFRLGEHNAEKVDSTRGKGPWVRVWLEEFPDKPAAYRREAELKAWKSHSRIEALIAGVCVERPVEREGR